MWLSRGWSVWGPDFLTSQAHPHRIRLYEHSLNISGGLFWQAKSRNNILSKVTRDLRLKWTPQFLLHLTHKGMRLSLAKRYMRVVIFRLTKISNNRNKDHNLQSHKLLGACERGMGCSQIIFFLISFISFLLWLESSGECSAKLDWNKRIGKTSFVT